MLERKDMDPDNVAWVQRLFVQMLCINVRTIDRSFDFLSNAVVGYTIQTSVLEYTWSNEGRKEGRKREFFFAVNNRYYLIV